MSTTQPPSSQSQSPKPKTSTYTTDQSQIAANNRGPITELLALPESCTQTLTYISSYYFGHYSSVFDPACVATGSLDSARLAPGDAWRKYYYSPAICPQGWTVAATFSKCFEVVPLNHCLTLGPETSAGLCCPSGYSSHSSGHQCASRITLGQSVTFIRPTPAGLGWDTGVPITNVAPESALVKGDGIPIWWQQSDAAMLSSAAAGTPSSVPAETTSRTGGGLLVEPTDSSATSSASGTSNTAASGSNNSSELSTGAKAGIGVGVALGVVVIGLVMGFFFWRRRRNRTKNVEGPQPVHMGDVYPSTPGGAPPPVYGHERQKMNPVYARQEMQGDDTRYELPGEQRQK